MWRKIKRYIPEGVCPFCDGTRLKAAPRSLKKKLQGVVCPRQEYTCQTCGWEFVSTPGYWRSPLCRLKFGCSVVLFVLFTGNLWLPPYHSEPAPSSSVVRPVRNIVLGPPLEKPEITTAEAGGSLKGHDFVSEAKASYSPQPVIKDRRAGGSHIFRARCIPPSALPRKRTTTNYSFSSEDVSTVSRK